MNLSHIPPNYVVERVRCSSKAARGEDVQVEHPVSCWDYASLYFHATPPSMLGSTLVWDQVVQVSQAGEKRLLAPIGFGARIPGSVLTPAEPGVMF
jgi:hypothetical protein